jgi:hypothetical protein
MKLTSQMPSSISLMPGLWPANTVEMFILWCRQSRPQAGTSVVKLVKEMMKSDLAIAKA